MQKGFASVVARVESLPPLLHFGDLQQGRMSDTERQALCRVHRDIEGLFESISETSG